MSKYLNLVTYFGGKFPHLQWLLPLFPAGNYHFVDMMSGAANVALNVDYPFITINDINNDIINLFRQLRENEEELLRSIYFTPFSREELNRIVTGRINEDKFDDLERARQYFCLCQLGYSANGSQNNHYGCGFEYQINKSKFYRVDNWNLKLNKLALIADKLRHFQIENKDVFDLYDNVNRRGNILYFDPPYVLKTRKSKKRYKHEVEDDFHRKLAEVIKDSKSFIAISGLDNSLYKKIFKDMYITKNKVTSNNTGKIELQECLWTNYNPETINSKAIQKTIFD